MAQLQDLGDKMKQPLPHSHHRKGRKIEFEIKKRIKNGKIAQLASSRPKKKILPAQKMIAGHVSALLKQFPDINRIPLNTLIRIWVSPKIQSDRLLQMQSIRDFRRSYPFISEAELRGWIEQLSDEVRRLK